jgi:hypothetical protein
MQCSANFSFKLWTYGHVDRCPMENSDLRDAHTHTHTHALARTHTHSHAHTRTHTHNKEYEQQGCAVLPLPNAPRGPPKYAVPTELAQEAGHLHGLTVPGVVAQHGVGLPGAAQAVWRSEGEGQFCHSLHKWAVVPTPDGDVEGKWNMLRRLGDG